LSENGESPKLEIVVGASLIKIVRAKREKVEPEIENQIKGDTAKRGKVTCFSRASRRRLFHTMAKVPRNNLPNFITLTYPKEFPVDCRTWKKHLDNFTKRLSYTFPDCSGIWKLEPQLRKAPHYHILIWGADVEELQEKVPYTWYEVVGSKDIKHLLFHQGKLGDGNENCVQPVTSSRFLFLYAAKYVAKPVEGWEDVGRWWGVFCRSNLPQGEHVSFEITEEKALDFLRYARRFARLPSRSYKSLTLMCDANQWMEKLQSEPMGSYREWLAANYVEESLQKIDGA